MDDATWLEGLRELAIEQSKIVSGDFTAIRAALATTYACLSSANALPADLYAQIPEPDLVSCARAHHAAIESDDWQWDLAGADLGEAVASAGARVRALDQLLKEVAPDHGPPADIGKDYHCRQTDWFVIPRLTARTARNGHGGRATFQQRGTLDHRLIPRKLGSYTVQLKWLGDIAPQRHDAALGAAMFEECEVLFKKKTSPKRFLATGITCPGSLDTIQSLVGKASDMDCLALAWPELTMRPDIEGSALRRAIGAIAVSASPLGAPAFTLAGSWHVKTGRGIQNVAPVLDSRGKQVFRHAKSRAYADNDYGLEDIYCGYRIPVMVTQERLIAFGICKDFCDARPGIPYPMLNVDLVIVGSIGNAKTMAGHRSAATMTAVLGTQSFVVQQDLKTGKGMTGWVLPPSREPDLFELPALRVGCWSTHPAQPN